MGLIVAEDDSWFVDEQDATEQLEAIVGSPEKCFMLMRMYGESNIPYGTVYDRLMGKISDTKTIFRSKAKKNGFSDKQIDAFLEYQELV